MSLLKTRRMGLGRGTVVSWPVGRGPTVITSGGLLRVASPTDKTISPRFIYRLHFVRASLDKRRVLETSPRRIRTDLSTEVKDNAISEDFIRDSLKQFQ